MNWFVTHLAVKGEIPRKGRSGFERLFYFLIHQGSFWFLMAALFANAVFSGKRIDVYTVFMAHRTFGVLEHHPKGNENQSHCEDPKGHGQLKNHAADPNTKAANVNFDRSKKYFAIFSLRIFTNSRASLFFSLLLSKSLMTKIVFIFHIPFYFTRKTSL